MRFIFSFNASFDLFNEQIKSVTHIFNLKSFTYFFIFIIIELYAKLFHLIFFIYFF